MSFGYKSKKPRAFLTEAELHEYAVKSLGSRMRSEADLRRLMRAKVEPDEGGGAKIGAVILRLKEYGYLDDTAFAENYTRAAAAEREVRRAAGEPGVEPQGDCAADHH